MRLLSFLVTFVALFVGLLALGQRDIVPVVITREGEQKIIFFLNEVRKLTKPGMAFRAPLLERVETYESRWLHASTEPLPIQTSDGEQLNIDNYVMWRIDEPVEYRRAFQGKMQNALDQIDRVVRDDVREVIGRHSLTEVLKERRQDIMIEITSKVRTALAEEGIEVGDVRINRTDLPAGTEGSVYARMNTERERLAKKSRAEGDERARRIRAEADREAQVIVANARRDAEIAKGLGDAEAAGIYAAAYGSDSKFYSFMRSLEAYRTAIDEKTTLVLSQDSEFFKYLQGPSGE